MKNENDISGKSTGKQTAIQAKNTTSKPNQTVYGCAVHPQCMPVADAVGALKAAADLAAKRQSPDKKVKLPKISDREAEDLTRTCRMAFGNDEADKFFDDVMARAIAKQEQRAARGEQTKTQKPI